MLKLSLKIWAVANLVVFAIFFFSLLPLGAGFGFKAVIHSSLFSVPAILILYCLFQGLKIVRGRTFFSWAALLIIIAVASYACCLVFDYWFNGYGEDMDFILPISLLSAYAAVMSFTSSIHQLFEKFEYEN